MHYADKLDLMVGMPSEDDLRELSSRGVATHYKASEAYRELRANFPVNANFEGRVRF